MNISYVPYTMLYNVSLKKKNHYILNKHYVLSKIPVGILIHTQQPRRDWHGFFIRIPISKQQMPAN